MLELLIYRAILAAKLQDAVIDKDLKQCVVAKRASKVLDGIKFDDSKISRIVSGKQDPTFLEAWALCQTLGIDLNNLIPPTVDAKWLKNAIERIEDL
jgi:Flp pilus assembly CpaE family ATPase